MGLKNPTGRAISEKYIYVQDPSLAEKVALLEKELAKEMAKEPAVKEVIKEVPSPANLELLEKYNGALREIGALKAMKPRLLQQVQPEPIVRTEIKEVEKVITKVLIKKDWRLVAIFSGASALVSGVLGALIF
jgi:hypothetical protein